MLLNDARDRERQRRRDANGVVVHVGGDEFVWQIRGGEVVRVRRVREGLPRAEREDWAERGDKGREQAEDSERRAHGARYARDLYHAPVASSSHSEALRGARDEDEGVFRYGVRERRRAFR